MAVLAAAPQGIRGLPSAVTYFSLGALWQWDRLRASEPVAYDTGVAPLKAEERGQKSPVPELSPEPASGQGEEEATDEPGPIEGADWRTPENAACALAGLHLAWCIASWAWRRRSVRPTRRVIRRYVGPVDAAATGVADRSTLRRRSRVA